MRTLWVEGSPKGPESLSSALADAYLAAAPAVFGDIERFSVWDDDVLRFGRDAAIAKFAPLFGERVTEEQGEIWQRVLAEIERVREFDRLVVSSPMWNWHVPHALKAWIDVIVQPLASFTVDQHGTHVGTLGEGKPLQLILTRSSAYDGRHPELQDFQRPYLEYVFGMLGYDVDTLVIEPTTRWTPDERAAMRAEAIDNAQRAGARLVDRSQ
jgi:FMN-dependent NADH-azoreductase